MNDPSTARDKSKPRETISPPAQTPGTSRGMRERMMAYARRMAADPVKADALLDRIGYPGVAAK